MRMVNGWSRCRLKRACNSSECTENNNYGEFDVKTGKVSYKYGINLDLATRSAKINTDLAREHAGLERISASSARPTSAS